MVDASTVDLDELLDPGFALVHITGYVQPKDEWFDVLRSGQFDYHRIEIDEKTIPVRIDGDAADLRGRGIFDATINGTRNPWRLEIQHASREAECPVDHHARALHDLLSAEHWSRRPCGIGKRTMRMGRAAALCLMGSASTLTRDTTLSPPDEMEI